MTSSYYTDAITTSLPARGAWIEITSGNSETPELSVAPREGSVDRNGYLYDKVDYLHGLGMCLELLKVCDKMLVYGDWEHSTGCKAEIDYCKTHGIPYVLHCDPKK